MWSHFVFTHLGSRACVVGGREQDTTTERVSGMMRGNNSDTELQGMTDSLRDSICVIFCFFASKIRLPDS